MRISKTVKYWNKNKGKTYLKRGEFKGFYRFDMGEPPFAITDRVNNVLKGFTIKDLKKRPDIYSRELRKKASEFWQIPSENIVVSNGSAQLIMLLPQLFLDYGDGSLIINPTFILFRDAILKAGGEIVDLETKIENNFAFTKRLIKDVIRRTNESSVRLIFLCNPNNPTGEAMSLEDIKMIASNVKALVVVDEAFFDLSDLPRSQSALNLLGKYGNVVVLKTLSKTFGISATRSGFAFADISIIELLNKWSLPFEVSRINQQLGVALLSDKNHFQKIKNQAKKERVKLLNEIGQLRDIGIGAETKTNIFIMRHKAKDLFEELCKRKILVADMRNIKGFQGMKFIRVTVGEEKDNKILINALKRICK